MKTIPCCLVLSLAILLSACVHENHSSQSAMAANLRTIAAKPQQVQVTLYTLNPYRSPLGKVDAPEVFHGFGVVGKANITAPADRQMLLDALATGIEGGKGASHVCFKPRHGLHVVADGQTTDYVICLQCLKMKVYGDKSAQTILISHAPAFAYTSTVKKYKITEPPK